MIALPTIEQVVEALEEYGVELRTLSKPLVGPRGKTEIQYLVREVDGKELRSLPLPTETTNMSWAVFDNHCRLLCLDPEAVKIPRVPRPPKWWLEGSAPVNAATSVETRDIEPPKQPN